MLGIAWSVDECEHSFDDSNEGSAQSSLIPVFLTPVVHLGLRISPRILEKIEMGAGEIIRGNMMHERNLRK
jgi:hypothetical protein